MLNEFDIPISDETYAYARAALIARAFRDRIEQIDDDLSEAFSFLDDLASLCSERAVEPSEVAELYPSDTLAILGTALFQAGHCEFDAERKRLDEIACLIRNATQDMRAAA